MACGNGGEGTGPRCFLINSGKQRLPLTTWKVLPKPLQALVALPRAGSCTLGVAAPHTGCQSSALAGCREKLLVPRGVASAEGLSLPPCPHGPVFPGIPWMLRWGFLEILFLRSWPNSWSCLLPTLAFPVWDAGGEGGTLEVRGLGRSLLTFALLFFPLCPYFITSPGGWMWEPQNRLTLEKLVPSRSG